MLREAPASHAERDSSGARDHGDPIEIMTIKRDWWEKAWSSKRFDKQRVMCVFAKARQKALDTY
eukprot:6148266-Pyramimonas_sp.AAC.1